MTIQFLFNLQKWGDEAKSLSKVKLKLDELTRGKLNFEFLPALYTDFTNIPFVVVPFPFSNETGEAPDPKWYLNLVYPVNREADALILVLKESEWKDNLTVPGRPYGYTSNQYPVTPPPFITILAESGDKSWKDSKVSALEYYVTHELGHAFSNLSGLQDKTHEFDVQRYGGKTDLQGLYDTFDYDKIKLVLSDKRKLDGQIMIVYKKKNDPTLFVDVAGKFVGISTDETKLRLDWPSYKVINLEPDEILKADFANWHTLAKRQ